MLKSILADISMERIEADVRFFTEHAPMRLAGSKSEAIASDYICEQLRAAGVPFDLQTVDGYLSFPRSASIEVLGENGRNIEAFPFAQAKPTPPEGIEAELVDVGPGGLGDYDGVDAAGKITLSALSYSPPRPEKVRIATAKSAVGQIMMNWGKPEHDTLPMGTCKSLWGNPTADTLSQLPNIPAVGIRKKDGEWLKAELAKRGSLRLRLKASLDNGWGQFVQPVARIEGSGEPEKFILLGGHFDAWGVGATDNATNNAQLMELARVLQSHRGKLRRSVVIALWSGHETGMMEGSTWYLDKYWDNVNRNCIMYIGIGSHALKGATDFVVESSPESADFARQMSAKMLNIPDQKINPMRRVGDQSFFGVGVPSLATNFEHPIEVKKEWNGASLGWWYHSDADTLDKVDYDLVRKGMEITAATTLELATQPVLPFDPALLVAELESRAGQLAHLDIGIDLKSLAVAAATLKGKIAQLQFPASAASDDEVARHNAIVMRMSRQLTPLLSTIGGKWEQDTYGRSALTTSLPGLFAAEAMANLPADSETFRLNWTEVARQRNRIFDGLNDAIREVDLHLAGAISGAI